MTAGPASPTRSFSFLTLRPTLAVVAALGAAAAASTVGARAARAGMVEDILAATATCSPGGAQLTGDELDTLVAAAGSAGADDAVRGMVAANAVRMAGAYADDLAYGRLQSAQRARVAGLTPGSEQAPGLDFTRAGDGALVARFATRGVDYARVDIIYSFDGWATTGAATLVPGCDAGVLEAALADAPPVATTGAYITYALHVFGRDDRDFWIANGRENGVYGGPVALNYNYPLVAASADPQPPSRPALALLVAQFAADFSPGGAVVANDEFSLLVEQLTYDGGSGVQDPVALGAVLGALDELVASGAVFESGAEDGMRGFVERQMLATASYPSAAFARGGDGQLLMTIGELGAVTATVIYTTDGWQQPKVAACSGAPLVCDLGAIPPGTLASYTLAVRDAGGGERWIRSVLGNFFGPLP